MGPLTVAGPMEGVAVISTNMSYQLIVRDLDRSMQRVESQPMVQRETEYFRENIGKVATIDDFLADTRLFNYAMKAHGLQDMSYAKGLMRKALEEGIAEPDSFANRLTDKRYADFVRSFNFAQHGASAATYNAATDGTSSRFVERALETGMPTELIAENMTYFQDRIRDITSPEELVADQRLMAVVLFAYEIEDYVNRPDQLVEALSGGVKDRDSPAKTMDDGKLLDFVTAFDFARLGAATTTQTAERASVEKYMRQTLEEDAGMQNEGVRLALYFERKAGTITSAFQILSDPALAQVVRTALGLPDSIAASDIDRQAALLESRIDFDSFSDPDELAKFINRFTTMWEVSNGASGANSPLLQLFQPTQAGISPDLLLTIAQTKR